jgi:two-component system chemotaxis response regulator CheY
MRFLIVEDEFVARRVLTRFLQPYGTVEVAVDGEEALDAVRAAIEERAPYSLVCLDVLMPKMDGHITLEKIHELERSRGIPLGTGAKIVMTTALSDPRTVMAAFKENVDAFLVKPIDHDKLRGGHPSGVAGAQGSASTQARAPPTPRRCQPSALNAPLERA